jgi:hypothetical protein
MLMHPSATKHNVQCQRFCNCYFESVSRLGVLQPTGHEHPQIRGIAINDPYVEEVSRGLMLALKHDPNDPFAEDTSGANDTVSGVAWIRLVGGFWPLTNELPNRCVVPQEPAKVEGLVDETPADYHPTQVT